MKPLSIHAALETILGSVAAVPAEKVKLEDALGLVLAEDVTARDDVPFTDNSGMDGFAVRSVDLDHASPASPVRLRVMPGLIAAGPSKPAAVAQAATIRIMTGATIPSAADAVVPQEQVRVEGGEAVFDAPAREGQHVRRSGEDMHAGEIALPRGTALDPAALGLAVLAGRPEVSAVRTPRVAIFTSGDELIGPGDAMQPGLVRNSNSYVLGAELVTMGCEVIDLGVARDVKADIYERLSLAMKADAIISSGGVSVGEKDLTREVMEELGLKLKFWGVNVKPGKPLLFGNLQNVPVFGLPGNPVSTHATFEIFVRPALRKMQGHADVFRPVIPVALGHDLKRKPGRPEFLRVRLERRGASFSASLTRTAQGSGVYSSFRDADGLLHVDGDTVFIPAGETAQCLWLRGREEPSFGIEAGAPASRRSR